MAKFTVKAESLPERCDICHQADLFDRETGECARCGPIARFVPPPDAPPPEFSPQLFEPPRPFAPPSVYPQFPFPYQPPVSPLAPVPPHVVHESPNYWEHQRQPRELFYRYIGPTENSQRDDFRAAFWGGLVGALPPFLLGLVFLVEHQFLLFFVFVLQGWLVTGYVSFRTRQRLKGLQTQTLARKIRRAGMSDSWKVTLSLVPIPYVLLYLFILRLNPDSPFAAALLISALLLPVVLGALALNFLGGYLSVLAVEHLERKHLVPTYLEPER
jgi:hypothetical protein